MSTRSAAAGRSPWVGWVAFAGVLLIMLGVFNAIDGLAALFADEFFVDTDEGTLVFNLTSWGWIHLVFGSLQVIMGIALFSGVRWARAGAVVLLVVNATAHMAFLASSPVWSALIIALNVVCIWALIVHGEEVTSA